MAIHAGPAPPCVSYRRVRRFGVLVLYLVQVASRPCEDAPGSHSWYGDGQPEPSGDRPQPTVTPDRQRQGATVCGLSCPACRHHAHRAVHSQVPSQLGQHVLPIAPVSGRPRPALMWRPSSPFASCRSPPSCEYPLGLPHPAPPEPLYPGRSVVPHLSSHSPHDLAAHSCPHTRHTAPLTRSPAAPCALPAMLAVGELDCSLAHPLACCALLLLFSPSSALCSFVASWRPHAARPRSACSLQLLCSSSHRLSIAVSLQPRRISFDTISCDTTPPE
jgi:hypothetical protein